MCAEKGPALFQKDHINLRGIELLRCQTLAEIFGVGIFRVAGFVDHTAWWIGHAVALDVGVEEIGGRAGGCAEELLETMIQRSAIKRSKIVDASDAFQSVLMDGLALLVVKGQPDVPLAHHGGGIARLLEHLGEGQLGIPDQARAADTGEDRAATRAETQATGHQRVACR